MPPCPLSYRWWYNMITFCLPLIRSGSSLPFRSLLRRPMTICPLSKRQNFIFQRRLWHGTRSRLYPAPHCIVSTDHILGEVLDEARVHSTTERPKISPTRSKARKDNLAVAMQCKKGRPSWDSNPQPFPYPACIGGERATIAPNGL